MLCDGSFLLSSSTARGPVAANSIQSSRELPRSLSSLAELFSFLDEHIQEHQLDQATAFRLHLAADELFTNMIRHNEGGAETISVAIDVTAESVALRLVDRDVAPFDPDDIPDVDITRPAEERKPGGLGIHFVRSIVDRVSYEYEDGEMSVSVVKNRVRG